MPCDVKIYVNSDHEPTSILYFYCQPRSTGDADIVLTSCL